MGHFKARLTVHGCWQVQEFRPSKSLEPGFTAQAALGLQHTSVRCISLSHSHLIQADLQVNLGPDGLIGAGNSRLRFLRINSKHFFAALLASFICVPHAYATSACPTASSPRPTCREPLALEACIRQCHLFKDWGAARHEAAACRHIAAQQQSGKRGQGSNSREGLRRGCSALAMPLT